MINKKYLIIDYLKAIAIMLVILGHSFSYVLKIEEDVPELIRIIVKLIYTVHVPLFFFISGFLCHKQNIKEFYKKKFVRIIIPFITFSILKLLYSNFIGEEFLHKNSIIMQLFNAFIIGDLYWFSYALFLIFLFIPIVWNNYEKYKKRILILNIISIIINILLMNYNFPPKYNFFQIFNLLLYLPYFLCGMMFFQYKKILLCIIEKNKIILIVLSAIMIIISSICYGVNINLFMIKYITFYPLALLIYYLVILIPKDFFLLKKIGDFSYQLMLFDSFYKVLLYKIISIFIRVDLWCAIPIALINIFLGVISCTLIRKIKYINFVFGLKNDRIEHINFKGVKNI